MKPSGLNPSAPLPSAPAADPYPSTRAARDRWIVDLRPERNPVDASRAYGAFLEEERADSSEIVSVATLLLTNRECPWRCLMCDLWRNTLPGPTPPGAVPAQIDSALAELRRQRRLPQDAPAAALARHLKLYNSGSFFDPRAVPRRDHEAIARAITGFEHVIVECHPLLVTDAVRAFHSRLGPRTTFEVALGLETADPETLARLNKGMTLDDFRRAATFLRQHDIAVRAFVLVQPPFQDEDQALHWACRSIEFAFDCGAAVVSLIPVRPGNGALDALQSSGQFAPPRLATLEAALTHGLSLRRGRVFADLWDLERFSDDSATFPARRRRLDQANRTQQWNP